MEKIIFVCTGNTCRSPLAESYAKSIFPKVDFESRGLMVSGNQISEHSRAVIESAGLPEPSAPQQLTESDIETGTLLVMTQSHKMMIESINENADVHLLSEYSGSPPSDVGDPFGGPHEVYQEVFQEIKRFIDQMNV